jgi:hypothetical protein
LAISPADAQYAPGPRLSESSNGELPLRALMIEESLCSIQKPMRKYTYAWIGGLSAVLIAQGAYVLTTLDGNKESDRATRGGLLVAMSMTVGGIAALSFMPKPELRACYRWHELKRDRLMSLQERVAFGEALMTRLAQTAERQTSWWLHGLAVTLGAAVGLGLGFGYEDNALRASAQGLGTFLMTEARILTRPTRAKRFLREYNALRVAAHPL